MNKRLFELSYTLRKEREQKNTFLFITILLAIIFINIIFKYFLVPIRQISNSMNPDIPENTYVMVNLTKKTPKVGDIVLLESQSKLNINFFYKIGSKICTFFTFQQINFLEDKELTSTSSTLRRVVGTPGDTIYMENNMVYVKEKDSKYYFSEFEMTKKSYDISTKNVPENWDKDLIITDNFAEFTLKEDEYFVLCDNRSSALDSRFYGCISSDQIRGTVLASYFPIKLFKIY